MLISITLPETNIFAPEKGWLEDDPFLLEWLIFRGYASSWEGSWWFQPIWTICSSKWIISPSRGEHKKCLKPPPRYDANFPGCIISLDLHTSPRMPVAIRMRYCYWVGGRSKSSRIVTLSQHTTTSHCHSTTLSPCDIINTSNLSHHKLFTLPETNIAHENPPFWWYLPGKIGIFMGYVSLQEGSHRII